MTLVANYPTKKDLKAAVGKPLKYIEIGVFPEYERNGRITVCNRPHLTGHKHEFFAIVTMQDGIIRKVE